MSTGVLLIRMVNEMREKTRNVRKRTRERRVRVGRRAGEAEGLELSGGSGSEVIGRTLDPRPGHTTTPHHQVYLNHCLNLVFQFLLYS
jgi:hypothetical protein